MSSSCRAEADVADELVVYRACTVEKGCLGGRW
jgi:hypothetical protein